MSLNFEINLEEFPLLNNIKEECIQNTLQQIFKLGY